MTTVVRVAVYASLAAALTVFGCVLELTWAPVHDAPNEMNLHVWSTPTPTPTPFQTSQ